jgi:S-adenosylmethionine uptake transporter
MPPREHHLLPYAATLLAIGLLSLMDALMKGASLAVGAYSALLLRSCLNLAVIGPAWLALRTAPTPPALRRLHVRRGVVVTLMALTFFWGLARMPLAEALALTFIAPIVALFLAALLLGERIERSAIIASVTGLAGVVLIALTAEGERRGGHPQAGLGIVAVLVSAVLYAWNLVLQRQQALLAAPVEVATWQNLMLVVLLLPGAPFLLERPQGDAWLLITGSGALSLTGALLFAWAYRRAEAQALAPLEYTGFLWAALFGWLFFAESVRPAVLGGAALILVGCWLAAPRGLRQRPEQSAA